jgi:hypothetical protein
VVVLARPPCECSLACVAGTVTTPVFHNRQKVSFEEIESYSGPPQLATSFVG